MYVTLTTHPSAIIRNHHHLRINSLFLQISSFNEELIKFFIFILFVFQFMLLKFRIFSIFFLLNVDKNQYKTADLVTRSRHHSLYKQLLINLVNFI